MNAKNNSSKNIRPDRSSSVSRVALMIFFLLIGAAHYGYVADAQRRL